MKDFGERCVGRKKLWTWKREVAVRLIGKGNGTCPLEAYLTLL